METIINTHPFTYVYGDFLSGFTLTPGHFLTANLDTVIPFNIDDCEDVDYQQKRDSAQELTGYWRKSQTIKPILGSVETRLFDGIKREFTTSHKESQSQISRQPKIGEIILVKVDNVLRRTWKSALIKEYVLSKDGQIRSVIIQLATQ